jgi:hypothetical protein
MSCIETQSEIVHFYLIKIVEQNIVLYPHFLPLLTESESSVSRETITLDLLLFDRNVLLHSKHSRIRVHLVTVSCGLAASRHTVAPPSPC